MLNHGESVEVHRTLVKAGGHAEVMYRGITRFLFEDADRSRSTTSSSPAAGLPAPGLPGDRP